MREWNAAAYHRVSDPQLKWGLIVLDRLLLEGDEVVIDAGCGTGRLTALLAERLPRGRVLAVDQSFNMLATAREHLATLSGARVCCIQADVAALPLVNVADAIFSTATFHWILDHPALFRCLHAALRPGGRLVAQCGGGPNIARIHDRCMVLMQQPRFKPYFRMWREPWEFADAETTARRLIETGFVDVRTDLEYAPVVQPTAEQFTEFVTNVICRPHLAHLPEPELQAAFVNELTMMAAADVPAFELDYWRLNLSARRPPGQT